jgi:biotin transport system substrate-specific component
MAVAVLALASQVEIPMQPVPLTLQTLAVVLTGFLLGPGLGFIATAIWLALGAAGLPLFAGGEGGIEHLTGPTAGYLLSFPFAATVAGFGARLAGLRIIGLFVAAIAAHALTLAAGGAWLATKIGLHDAVAFGVRPFLLGAVLKSATAVIVILLVEAALRLVRGREARRD